MKPVKRYLGSFLMAAVLAAPVAITTAAHPQSASVRVYDSGHKDYHNWDDNENKHWQVYLSDNHKKSHDYKKASKKEQSDYWNWRHDHPDDKH